MPRLRMCPDFDLRLPVINPDNDDDEEDEELALTSHSTQKHTHIPVDLSAAPRSRFQALVPDGHNEKGRQASGGRLPDAWSADRSQCSRNSDANLTEMPRVVDNQRDKFNTDAVFRRLARECEVRYAGAPLERPVDQRRRQFELDLDRGFLVMSILSSGVHIMLSFRSPRTVPEASTSQEADPFVAEIRNNQLFLQSKMIFNGVCVIWNGYVDMDSLDGVGRIEFDTATADREHTAAFGGRGAS